MPIIALIMRTLIFSAGKYRRAEHPKIWRIADVFYREHVKGFWTKI